MKRSVLCFATLLFLSLILLPACGGLSPMNPDGLGTVVPAMNGGQVVSDDGKMILSVAPGALQKDTAISIKAFAVGGGIGYEMKPDGLQFLIPAEATFELPQAKPEDAPETLTDTPVLPDVALFLESADGEVEALQGTQIESNPEDPNYLVRTSIPHFSNLIAVTGNSYYLYMESPGTHYVGSSFKRNLDARYLGYQSTHAFKNRSIDYVVKSITVNKFTMTSGKPIGLVSPKEIKRSDFLSKRGATSSTRPKFICNNPGKATVEAKVEVTSVVQVTFKPENKTRHFTVNQSSSTTRKGNCLQPSFGFRNESYGLSEDEATLVAQVEDPSQDLLVYQDGAGEPAEGYEVPGFLDLQEASIFVRGDAIEANLLLAGISPDTLPEYLQIWTMNLAVLDFELGVPELGLFQGTQFQAAVEGFENHEGLQANLYEWTEGTYVVFEENPVEFAISDDRVSILVPLSSLELSQEEALDREYRIHTQSMFKGGYPHAGEMLVDILDL